MSDGASTSLSSFPRVLDDSLDLPAYVLRRIPRPTAHARSAATELAVHLLDAAKLGGPSVALILGGSFARGEPCIGLDATGRPTIYSDVDLLLVHSTRRPATMESVRHYLSRTVPNATLYSLSEEQYSGLGTAIGAEYSDHAIGLGPMTIRRQPVGGVAPRDAAEVAIYAVVEYFEVHSRYLMGDTSSGSARYWVNRLILCACRTISMLRGAFYYHETDVFEPDLRSVVERELAWRDGNRPDLRSNLTDVWATLARVLALHRTEGFLASSLDAVTGTPYLSKPGGEYAAYFQRLSLTLFDEVWSRLEAGTEGTELRDIEQEAWRATLRHYPGLARPAVTPYQFFKERAGCYREQLFSMKL